MVPSGAGKASALLEGGKTLGIEPGPFYGSLVGMYGFQYKCKKECTDS